MLRDGQWKNFGILMLHVRAMFAATDSVLFLFAHRLPFFLFFPPSEDFFIYTICLMLSLKEEQGTVMRESQGVLQISFIYFSKKRKEKNFCLIASHVSRRLFSSSFSSSSFSLFQLHHASKDQKRDTEREREGRWNWWRGSVPGVHSLHCCYSFFPLLPSSPAAPFSPSF